MIGASQIRQLETSARPAVKLHHRVDVLDPSPDSMFPIQQQIEETAAKQDGNRREMEAAEIAGQREQEWAAAEIIQVSNIHHRLGLRWSID